jgi:shikimate 5-dehydrogenase
MLVYQGALSLEMWTGREAPIAEMEEAAQQALTG